LVLSGFESTLERVSLVRPFDKASECIRVAAAAAFTENEFSSVLGSNINELESSDVIPSSIMLSSWLNDGEWSDACCCCCACDCG